MSVLEFIKVVILGIVEGITEWLPISSTGHMILVDEFIKMDMTTEFKDFFLVVIQLGAILAVVVLYWSKLWPFYIRQIPKKKKAQILAADDEPMYVDDDYYWRNGWYSNPDDRRLFIQDRYSSMNYTVNLGRTAGKVITGITYGLLIVMMAGFCLWLLKIDFTPVRMQVTDTTVTVTSGYSNISFDRDEIEDLQLLDALPADNFYKVNGSADSKQYMGKFKGKETGKCQMYVTLDVTPILEIKTPEYTIFINSREGGMAESWYQELKQ